MTPNEQTLTTFQTRIRQMLLRFQELKKENEELYAMLEQNEQDISTLKSKLKQQEDEFMALKMARMMTIADGDLESAKSRLAKLIRDVNKCIAILSDEN